MPTKLQRKAALRVERNAPSEADLNSNTFSRGYKAFVGSSKGITGTPRQKIDQARKLAAATKRKRT